MHICPCRRSYPVYVQADRVAPTGAMQVTETQDLVCLATVFFLFLGSGRHTDEANVVNGQPRGAKRTFVLSLPTGRIPCGRGTRRYPGAVAGTKGVIRGMYVNTTWRVWLVTRSLVGSRLAKGASPPAPELALSMGVLEDEGWKGSQCRCYLELKPPSLKAVILALSANLDSFFS